MRSKLNAKFRGITNVYQSNAKMQTNVNVRFSLVGMNWGIYWNLIYHGCLEIYLNIPEFSFKVFRVSNDDTWNYGLHPVSNPQWTLCFCNSNHDPDQYWVELHPYWRILHLKIGSGHKSILESKGVCKLECGISDSCLNHTLVTIYRYCWRAIFLRWWQTLSLNVNQGDLHTFLSPYPGGVSCLNSTEHYLAV